MLSGTATSKDKKYHLYFIRARKDPNKKMPVYIVRKDSMRADGEYLGYIRFNGAWRQYVFHPDQNSYWSSGCLELITEFLNKVNKKFRDSIRRKANGGNKNVKMRKM